MDINITRRALVEHANALLTALREQEDDTVSELAGELAYEVTCMTEWLDKGGFAPSDGVPWRAANDSNMRKLAASIMGMADRNDTRPMMRPGRIMAREISYVARNM